MTSFVCRLIIAWTRVYTLGLPPVVRRQRIEVILADLADQCTDEGSSASQALGLASRCLRGVAADLAWRLFDARNVSAIAPVLDVERRRPVNTRKAKTQFYFIAAQVAWLTVLVLAVEAPGRSLTWAGALMGVTALTAWALDAFRESDETSPSPWPLLLATGISAGAAGAVFDGGYTGLLLAVPLAAGLSLAFLRGWAACRAGRGPGGSEPLPAADLAAQAGQGKAIAIEHGPEAGVSRRALLRGGFGVGLASVLATMGGVVVDFLWQRNVAGFGGVVTAGPASQFPPGSKTKIREGKFWLVNLTEAQGGPGFLALWQKCPHLGCTVPWEENVTFVDPETGDASRGWFRCPCHQSTYNHAGVRVYGPAPRSMDRMALRITEDGYIEVDTGDISKGAEDNASYAVES